MKKPLFMAGLLAVALVVVIFAKAKLDQAIKDGKFVDTPSAEAPHTIDIGIQQDPKAMEQAEVAHQSSGTSKTDVMAALVEARQAFRSKPDVTSEAKNDPHSTPPTIIRAAETLGKILTLEKQNPAYKPEFQAFYIECAKDSEVLTVTRVQCLETYVKSKELSAAEEEKILSEVDPTVQSLYKELKR